MKLCKTLAAAMFFAATAASSGTHAADAYPNRPIMLVVPFTPGSGTDVSARQLGKTLSEKSGQQVIVENRPGGNNAIGVRHVVNAAPDGYTILIGTNSPVAGNVALFKSLAYDPVKDLKPVAPLSRQDWVVVVKSDSRFKTLKELLAAGKQDPLLLTAGAGAAGYQLAAMMLAKNAGADVNVIPYSGTPQAVQDVLGGRLSFAVVDAGSVLTQIKGGNLRAIGALAEDRIELLPDVPTLKELGLPSIPLMSWAGIFVPARTPDDVVTKLQGLIEASLITNQLRDYYKSIGAVTLSGGPDELRKMQTADITVYRDAMKKTGLPQI